MYFRDDLENIHADDNCGDFAYAAAYFHLDPKKPFVSISPLDPNQTPSAVGLYIVNINTNSGNSAGDCLVAFRFAAPEIRNSAAGENYRIIITDTDGTPSVVSFAHKIGSPLVEARISQRESDAQNICNYLYKHTAELRCKVEKM